MKIQEFWDVIEDAWSGIPDAAVYRANLAIGDVDSLDGVCEALPRFLQAMRTRMGLLSDEEVMAFDGILERTLYRLDRPELHRYTNGSNDAFLYHRGFVVALGKAYHDAIDRDESLAMFSVRYFCEEMTYVTYLLSRGRAELLFPLKVTVAPNLDRESFQNKGAWARGSASFSRTARVNVVQSTVWIRALT